MRSIAVGFSLVMLLAIVGCGGSGEAVTGLVPVAGKINYGTAKVEPGKVVFWSTFDGPNFTGDVDASGAFSLNLGPQKGAMPGKYKVTLTGKGAPKIYTNEKSTPLVVEVSASNPTVEITLK